MADRLPSCVLDVHPSWLSSHLITSEVSSCLVSLCGAAWGLIYCPPAGSEGTTRSVVLLALLHLASSTPKQIRQLCIQALVSVTGSKGQRPDHSRESGPEMIAPTLLRESLHSTVRHPPRIQGYSTTTSLRNMSYLLMIHDYYCAQPRGIPSV